MDRKTQRLSTDTSPSREVCPRCNGARKEGRLAEQILSENGVCIETPPYGTWLPTKTRSLLDVLVCTNCGYIELYAANPKEL